jgi:hypothetical protein
MMMPAKGMELPHHVDQRLREEFNCRMVPREQYEHENAAVDALYVTPDEPHQLSLIPNVDPTVVKLRKKVDVFYVTRFQKERWAEAKGDYPKIDSKFLKEAKYADTSVLHPLPRVGELDTALDSDSRAVYFRQASYGVPVRMALIDLLTRRSDGLARTDTGFGEAARTLYDRPNDVGMRCANDNCIVHDPLEKHYTRNKFWLLPGAEGRQRLRCIYCEADSEAAIVGHAKKHEFHTADGAEITEDTVFFRDEEAAHAAGYRDRRKKRA